MTATDDAVGLTALRKVDPDRYLATLYAPADKRDALSALYLFNAEIAAIRDRVHEPLPGEIRLQWWRDALAGGRDAVAGHPLAMALARVIDDHDLPLAAFDRYLEARIFDLYDDPMPSRADLEGYCGETASAVVQLAALILEPEAAPQFSAASGHGGCAIAITGMLRQLPLHRARGQCFFPAEMLEAAGTSREALLSGDDNAAVQHAVEAMVALGREHLARFGAEAGAMPVSLRPAFLPAAPVSAYLDRIAAHPSDALVRPTDISAIRRHWIMLRKATGGWG
ncbi:phytoene/squalene synthase family protein [Mesorhizobium sp. CAU 1741]|uniref:phytoene/squalene synthase family protein n=1 Tax=Mesorhizobium sp. CAU 1741 TaxID=3140366 RepID=UPI00325B2675